MEFRNISDVIVRRLEGRCRFRIGTTSEQTLWQQRPDNALYSVPSRLRCVRAASSRFGNALNAWLRACKGTSAADPTSRDYSRWQPGARRCKLTLIDDGPRVDETARALARMPHEESRTVGRDLRKWLTGRHPWAGADRIRDLRDHETGSLAPAGSSDFGEQLQKLNEKWSDDIEIDKSVGNNDEPTTARPVVLRRSDELGETRVLAALLTPQTGYSYEQVLGALKKTEGESRRQLFLEVGDIRRYHADELNDALEMLSYEFRMLVSREQLALIRSTTHATVIEEALRPDDMPEGPGNWPTGPVQANGHFSGTDHWKKTQEALRKEYDEIAAEYGQHDAEYLLPGGTRNRITVNTNVTCDRGPGATGRQNTCNAGGRRRRVREALRRCRRTTALAPFRQRARAAAARTRQPLDDRVHGGLQGPDHARVLGAQETVRTGHRPPCTDRTRDTAGRVRSP